MPERSRRSAKDANDGGAGFKPALLPLSIVEYFCRL